MSNYDEQVLKDYEEQPATTEAQVVEEEKATKEVEKEKASATPIVVNQESQLIIARDNAELFRMVSMFMKGTAFPKTINTPEKAIAAWQIAASLNLPPMVVMQNLAFIHGSVSMWGQLPKALAERTGQLEEFKLVLFDSNQKVISLADANLTADVWGAAVTMRRSKRSANEYFFTEPEAKKAGLLTKAGPWTDYRKIMYARRCIGQGSKFEFPDALMGVPVAEYDFNEAPDLKDVTSTSDRASEFNEKLTKLADKPLAT